MKLVDLYKVTRGKVNDWEANSKFSHFQSNAFYIPLNTDERRNGD